MKLVLFALFSLSVIFAQAQDSVNKKIAHVPVPKQARQITLSEFNNFAKQNFKTKTEALTDGESFIAGNLLVSIYQGQFKYTLEQWKNGQEAMAKQLGLPWIDSKYMTFSNIRYYIMENNFRNDCRLDFFSEPNNGNNLSGFMKFKPKNRDEAYKYLNELLSNVEFKK